MVMSVFVNGDFAEGKRNEEHWSGKKSSQKVSRNKKVLTMLGHRLNFNYAWKLSEFVSAST